VQKQWLNLYLFNISDISFYSFLYYLSGTICPFLIGLNSLNNYTYYKFNKKHNTRKKTIRGRTLLFLVAINLIFLSFLITKYLYINFDFVCSLFLEGIKLEPDIYQLCSFILLISTLLIFKKSRLLFKKLVLINFILISFFIWFSQINNINVDDQFHIYRYFGLKDLNLINLFILVFIEISFYTWSFLSYKTNLSDWIVPKPQKGDLIIILDMFTFYFFIIIYYTILT
jgi:hypothetical protein